MYHRVAIFKMNSLAEFDIYIQDIDKHALNALIIWSRMTW
jgi:hypothetical protein